ncbi:MAG TPA: PilZ domain-containing protein [Polyangiaceae bacterium]
MPKPPTDHFRSLGRHPADLPVRVSVVGREGSHAARLLDLGLGGACLEIAERYERGDRLRVELDLPGLWDPLVLDAEVAWCEPRAEGAARAGLRFVGASGRSLRLIAEAIAVA